MTAVFPSADPRRATLSTLPHVLTLDVAKTASGQLPLEALPVGFIVEAAKVIQDVQDQGIYVDIGIDGVRGFVHVFPLGKHLTLDLSSIGSKNRFSPSQHWALQTLFRSPWKNNRIQPCRQSLLIIF